MNKDNYKKAIDQIHASNELKEKTILKMKQKSSQKFSYIKYISAVAVACLVFSIGFLELSEREKINANTVENPEVKPIAKINDDLPRFKNMNELKDYLKDGNSEYTRGTVKSEAILSFDSIEQKENSISDVALGENSELGNVENYRDDFSKTNNQVENVDEADIVKTDGNYIYYSTRGKIFIVKADNLEIVSTIEINEKTRRFNPQELFINNDKLIVLGNLYEYEEVVETNPISDFNYEGIVELDDSAPSIKRSSNTRIKETSIAKAIVYDISDKENLKVIKEFGLDGNYSNSRMIGDNVYFISRKYTYYYNDLKDDEILPRIQNGEETKLVECVDIAYFNNSNNHNYMLVGGFNINNDEDMHVETFLGASETIYASENNLYLAQTEYDNGSFYDSDTTIYKFALDNSQVVLTAKTRLKGYLNNQFSMDEYDGNLRVATTYMISQTPQEEQKMTEDDVEVSIVLPFEDVVYGNRLYILDEDLKEIGKIDNLAEDEKIYSVRFIGKIGYIVTFKEVDPLFVIDLSDPTNPEIKGELKIPGYSSYLHPYDETHIIGIGYNTKDNGYGGITNDNMKMSMFDVSDLENPKEMFSIDIGKKYVYSQILYDHKALFYKKSENLIGFPVSYDGQNKVELFKIDLEKGFEKYAEISNGKNSFNIERVIYIKDIVYVLEYDKIVAYSLDNFEKLNELKLD